ncbi:tumor suppressor candidate 2-like [Babylonia areolata]|uniref:tumor suppressor candidate 2-like n=1 Tax=Babylonia areolata TaxID=304850 RepID=UPI003FD31C09
MGQTATSLARTATKPVSWLLGRSGSDNEVNSHCRGLVPCGASLFVYKRRGSMFFDEDGDLAHEFYKQVVRGNRLTMERCVDNLEPQGEVDLPIPRLNGDLPVIMYELPSTVPTTAASR